MADMPEYQRGTRINPGSPVQGFEQALGNYGSATADIGAFGSQLAQNAANQMAREKGVEAAQTPGRNLIPSFTQADAEFSKAYKQEEGNVLQYQGAQSLKKMYEDVNKNPNPTSKDLELYEQNARKSIDGLLELSDASNKSALKRSLEGSYEGYFYDLSNKVSNANRKYLDDSLSAQSETTREQMNTASREGRVDQAKVFFDKRIEQIEQRAALDGLSQERVKQIKEQEAELYQLGMGEYQYLQQSEQEKPNFIADIRKEPEKHDFLKGMNAVQQDRVITGLQQFASQYDSAFKGQQYVNYAGLLAKLKEGKLSDVELNAAVDENRISAKQIADLGIQQARTSVKSNRIHNEGTAIAGNYDNAVFLANTTDAPRNYAVDKIIMPLAEKQKGGPLNLTEQSQLLSGFKAPVESLQKRMSAALTAGTPQQKMDVSKAVAIAKESNPILIRGMSKNDMALAGLYDSYSKNPEAMTEEGFKKIEDKVLNVSREDLEERQLKSDTYFKDKGLGDADYLKKATLDALELDKKASLPAGLTIVYSNLIRDAIMRTGDVKQAEQEAAYELKEFYGADKKGRVMYMPPEKAYTNLGYILDNDKLRSVKNMVEANKSFQKEHGYTMTDIDWDDMPDFSKMTLGELHRGDLELKVNGQMRPIVIQSDIATQLSPLNELSWAIGFMDSNNIFNPIIDPNGRAGSYRFYPDKELYQMAENDPIIKNKIADSERASAKKEMTDYEKEQLAKAYKMREMQNRFNVPNIARSAIEEPEND